MVSNQLIGGQLFGAGGAGGRSRGRSPGLERWAGGQEKGKGGRGSGGRTHLADEGLEVVVLEELREYLLGKFRRIEDSKALA